MVLATRLDVDRPVLLHLDMLDCCGSSPATVPQTLCFRMFQNVSLWDL